jgi:hypothetical protein
MRDWIQVSKLKDVPMCERPIEPSTAYKWHHVGRFPELFKRAGGNLFFERGLFYEKADAGLLK